MPLCVVFCVIACMRKLRTTLNAMLKHRVSRGANHSLVALSC